MIYEQISKNILMREFYGIKKKIASAISFLLKEGVLIFLISHEKEKFCLFCFTMISIGDRCENFMIGL